MQNPDAIDRLIAVGRPDLAERLKHLAGKHNQSRHGWRFAKGGDDAARLGAARRSLRGRDAGERAEYRRRAGMPEAKPMERKQPPQRESEDADEFEVMGNKIRYVENKYMSVNGKRADMSPLKDVHEDVRASVLYTIENALGQGRAGPIYKKIAFYKNSGRDNRARYESIIPGTGADRIRDQHRKNMEGDRAAQTALENFLEVFP